MPRSGRLPPLRARLALAAALLFAACQVDVDGAPCRGPGSAADCPDGQACGNDLRCSARALACATSRCNPGVTECADTTKARRCDGIADRVCGRWVVDDCAARLMECPGVRSGACECPELVGTVVVADPSVHSVRGEPPFPTGQAQPPECRFGRLGDALVAAAERAPAAATARIEGETGVVAAFGAVTGEEWPLVVATNVTVVAASPQPAPIIRGEPGVPTIVAVQGALEDVRVEGGGATGVGVALSCGASGKPELRRVEVDGGGVLDPDGLVTAGLSAGVTVAGTCGSARLSGVQVSAVAGPALSIDPAAAATVDVLGGSFGGSNVGIWIRGQKVSVVPDPDTAASTVVWGNSGEGVVIGGLPATAVEATLERMIVTANGGTGIVMQGLTSPSRVVARACDVSGNGAVRPAKYGPGLDPERRKSGGVLVRLGPIAAFTFSGNRLWANAGDQLAFESNADWSISAPPCGSETNVFACMTGDTCDVAADVGGTCAVALLGAGSVQADSNMWPGTPTYLYVMEPAVTATSYCDGTEPGVPAKPTCPQ